MTRMTLSPLDRRFLDLMDRIERTQQEQIMALTRRLEAAERRNRELEERIAALEDMNTREDTSLTSLNAALARLLDPSDSPPSSSTSPDVSGT
jgi:predicted  nucleic acid-binding Zn-ribbon protein